MGEVKEVVKMVTWREVEGKKKREILEYLLNRSYKKKHFTLALQYKYNLLRWEKAEGKDYDEIWLINIFPIFAKENGAVVLRFLGVKDGVVEFFKVIGKRKEWKELTPKELLQLRIESAELKKEREYDPYNFSNFWDKELIDWLIRYKVKVEGETIPKVVETFKKMVEPLQSYYLQEALLEWLVENKKGPEALQQVDIKKVVTDYLKEKRENLGKILMLL